MVAEPETIGRYGRTIAEPETFRKFHEGLRKSLRLSTNSRRTPSKQVHKACAGPHNPLKRTKLHLASFKLRHFSAWPPSLYLQFATTTSLHLTHGCYWVTIGGCVKLKHFSALSSGAGIRPPPKRPRKTFIQSGFSASSVWLSSYPKIL